MSAPRFAAGGGAASAGPMATMKAAVIREVGGPEVLKIEHVPVPKPEPGQVLLHTTKLCDRTLASSGLDRCGHHWRMFIAWDVVSCSHGTPSVPAVIAVTQLAIHCHYIAFLGDVRDAAVCGSRAHQAAVSMDTVRHAR